MKTLRGSGMASAQQLDDAEGRRNGSQSDLEASKTRVVVPATAIVRDGEQASAWRVKQDKLQKVPVAIADRDARSGDFVLKAGLQEGDHVVRYPTAGLKEGQPVQASVSPSSSMAADAAR